MLQNEKGITIITLAITILVLIIITGVVTSSGMESIRNTKRTAFISELEIIQAKVNTIHEKMNSSDTDTQYYNSIGKSINIVKDDILNKVLNGIPKDDFRYFDNEQLKKIGLDNINQEVIINYKTREVISLTGIEIEGKMYYKLKDIPNYISYNVEYKEKNNIAPTFTVEVIKEDEGIYKFMIKNIVYRSNVNSGTISYREINDKNWILNGNNTSFIINRQGTYEIKLTDKAGNSSIQTISTENIN